MATTPISSSSLVKRSLSNPAEEQKNPLKSIFSSSTPLLAPQPKYSISPLSASASPPSEDRSLKPTSELFSKTVNTPREPLPISPPFSSLYVPDLYDEKKETFLFEKSPVQNGVITKSESISIFNPNPPSPINRKVRRTIAPPGNEPAIKPSSKKRSQPKESDLQSMEPEEDLFFFAGGFEEVSPSGNEPATKPSSKKTSQSEWSDSKSMKPEEGLFFFAGGFKEVSPFRLDPEKSEDNKF